MAKKKGTNYEDAAAELLGAMTGVREVGRRLRLLDEDGVEREFDIVFESEVFGKRLRHVVECKDERKRVGPGVVEEFATRALRVKANHAIVVSAAGFTEPALTKARARNVTAITVADTRATAHLAKLPFVLVHYRWMWVVEHVHLTLRTESPRPDVDLDRLCTTLQTLAAEGAIHRVLHCLPTSMHAIATMRIHFPSPFPEFGLPVEALAHFDLRNVVTPCVGSCEASGECYYDWHDRRWCVPPKKTMNLRWTIGNDPMASVQQELAYLEAGNGLFAFQLKPPKRELPDTIAVRLTSFKELPWSGRSGIPDYARALRKNVNPDLIWSASQR